VLDNPVQFAVVREDPLVESALVREGAERALLVASGGCTALALRALHPELELTLFDLNPAQLALAEEKRRALEAGDRAALAALAQAGNFESLFAGLRAFWRDLVFGDGEIEALFEGEADLAAIFARKYWPIGFDLFFSDALLRAMFGPQAIQHAPPGSYPRYFQALFERGLARADARDNYFLHHVFLGRYLDRSGPPYLELLGRPIRAFEVVQGPIDAVPDLSRFDLVSLSNLFDWMAQDEAARIARRLGDELSPGARVVLRQLNTQLDPGALFGDRFRSDESLAGELLARDRSLFYRRLWIGRR
jgi:S-adenosylmethionine-diacylglycerol 3-amino-3-carboxypropyl transferase